MTQPAPLDFSQLARALDALQDAIDVLANRDWFEAQPQAVRSTLVSGTVQCVEFVYDLAIKSLRRTLEHHFADAVLEAAPALLADARARQARSDRMAQV